LSGIEQVTASTVSKIRRYLAAKSLNESETKNALIEPVLEALGWDVRDMDQVRLEYACGRNPVDYAFLLGPGSSPAMLLEAKALGGCIRSE